MEEIFLTLLVNPDIEVLTQTGIALLSTIVLSTARAIPFLAIFPLIAQFNLPTGVLTTGIAIGLSFPIMPHVYAQITVFEPDYLTTPHFMALFIKELLLGAVLALPFAIPFWAASMAGEVVELTAGLGSSADGAESGGAFSQYLLILLSIVLLENEWFREIILRRYYESYALWPVLSFVPEVSMESGSYLLQVLDAIMKIGMVIVLPLLATFLLVDVVSGLAFKYTPQFNPMMEASGYKTLLLVLILPTFTAIILAYADRYLLTLFTALADLQPLVTLRNLEAN